MNPYVADAAQLRGSECVISQTITDLDGDIVSRCIRRICRVSPATATRTADDSASPSIRIDGAGIRGIVTGGDLQGRALRSYCRQARHPDSQTRINEAATQNAITGSTDVRLKTSRMKAANAMPASAVENTAPVQTGS